MLIEIGYSYSKLVSIVMPYTAEEFWQEFKSNTLCPSSLITNGLKYSNVELFDKIEQLDSLKSSVNQRYELMRNAEYKTLSQFEVVVPEQYFNNDELQIYLGVAKVETGTFEVKYTLGKKCPRCWSYHYDTTELCTRCEEVENEECKS